MRKLFSLLLLTSFVLSAAAVRADTIYLKNGSVLKGKVASFADDQFIVLLDMGGGKFMSRAMIYMGDVTRIEFEGAPAAAASDPIGASAKEVTREVQPSEPPPSEKSSSETEVSKNSEPPKTNSEPPKTNESTERDKSAEEREKSSEKSPEKSTSETAPPESEPKSEPKRDPEPTPVEKVEKTEPPPVDPPAEKPTRKPSGPVRTQTVDVAAKRDWTSTGLIVKRGDRVTINASGTVTLDPGSERTSGPEGIETSDARKLLPDQPTGALIAVIGADNDEFIFVGRSTEFIATRDGLLFLSVNEGVLSDNTGSYKAVIEIETQRSGK